MSLFGLRRKFYSVYVLALVAWLCVIGEIIVLLYFLGHDISEHPWWCWVYSRPTLLWEGQWWSLKSNEATVCTVCVRFMSMVCGVMVYCCVTPVSSRSCWSKTKHNLKGQLPFDVANVSPCAVSHFIFKNLISFSKGCLFFWSRFLCLYRHFILACMISCNELM